MDRAAVAAKVIWFCQTFQVIGLAYDRWRIDELIRELERAEFETFKDGKKNETGLRLVHGARASRTWRRRSMRWKPA